MGKTAEITSRKIGGKLSDLKVAGNMVLAEVLDIEKQGSIFVVSDTLNADFKVVKTGPGYYDDQGNVVKQCFAKKGDYVTFDTGQGHFNLEIEGKQYVMFPDNSVLCASLEPAGVL